MFAVEITNDTEMCQPVDTTVYFPNNPIRMSAATNGADLRSTCSKSADMMDFLCLHHGHKNVTWWTLYAAATE